MSEQLLRLNAGQVELQAAAAGDRKGPRRWTAKAYNGGPLKLNGFADPVLVDLAGLTFPARPVAANLFHDETKLVGHIDGHENSGRELVLFGPVSGTGPAAVEFMGNHDNGFPWQASIEARPLTAMEYVPSGKQVSANGRTFNGPVLVARKTELSGIAFLPRGADENTQVSLAATRKTTMTTSTETTDILTAERARVATINAKCDTAPAIVAEQLAHRLGELRATAVNDGWSLDRLDAELVRCERDAYLRREFLASAPKGPSIHASNSDAGEQLLQAAFCRTLGLDVERHFKPEVLEACDAARLRGVGLHHLLLRAAASAGVQEQTLRASNLRDVLQAAFSTHTITTLLTTTGNKLLADGFDAVEAVWREISRIRSVENFKSYTSYRLNASLVYEELGPGGEIKHGTASQESWTIRAKTYARMMSLTREDIINDDLSAFDDLRNRLGRGAALKLNNEFWKAFLNNSAFFTSGRANLLTGAGSALDADGLAAAEKAFMELADEDGHPLGITPALILVPSDLAVVARQLYVSQERRDTTADTEYLVANIWQNRFKPLVSAYLNKVAYTGYSTTAWYLLADPRNLPVMEVAFLNGQQSPMVETADADFNTLGIDMRGVYDFGIAQAEWRAGVKSAGA